MHNLNINPEIVSKLISNKKLKKIYTQIGEIFGKKNISTYKKLVILLESEASLDFNEYLNKIKLFSKLLLIKNLISEDKLSKISSKYNIKIPVQFSNPVIHVSSNNLNSKNSIIDAHQDWPSTLGSFNSIIIWIPLGGCDSKNGGLTFYRHKKRINQILCAKSAEHVVKIEPKDLKDYESKYIYANTGDGIVFGHLIPHSSVSGSTRISVSLRIEDASDVDWSRRKYEYAQQTIISRREITNDERKKINNYLRKNQMDI